MSTGQLDEFNLDGKANDDVHFFNFFVSVKQVNILSENLNLCC